jgi:hypothetical protein
MITIKINSAGSAVCQSSLMQNTKGPDTNRDL